MKEKNSEAGGGGGTAAFATLFGLIGDAAIVIDGSTGRITAANAALATRAGRPSGVLAGASAEGLIELDPPEAGWLARAEGKSNGWLLAGAGVRIPVEIRWRGVGSGETVVILHDRRAQLEAEALGRSVALMQRTQALGQMASGIAHDFNNTLMATLPWADLLHRKFPDEPTIVKAADQIRRSVHRAKEVTRQLLDFAQPRRPQKTRVRLGDLVRQQMKMIRPALPPEIEIDVRVDENAEVDADAAQLGQVLLNLALNARDAMPGGGSFSVTVRPPSPEEARAWRAEPEAFVVLAVRDTGRGIPERDRDAIFDPFFTTKELGKATGLGLPVVVRLVEQHAGSIHVVSEPGQGTSFFVVLPRAVAAVAETTEAAERPLGFLTGRRVFVVDDETAILEGVEMLLEMEGASVEAFTRGAELVARLEREPVPDLVVLDLGMPEMSGREVHAAVRRRFPDLPILVSSGYGDAERVDELLTDRRTAYRQKPYDADALFGAIDELLKR